MPRRIGGVGPGKGERKRRGSTQSRVRVQRFLSSSPPTVFSLLGLRSLSKFSQTTFYHSYGAEGGERGSPSTMHLASLVSVASQSPAPSSLPSLAHERRFLINASPFSNSPYGILFPTAWPPPSPCTVARRPMRPALVGMFSAQDPADYATPCSGYNKAPSQAALAIASGLSSPRAALLPGPPPRRAQFIYRGERADSLTFISWENTSRSPFSSSGPHVSRTSSPDGSALLSRTTYLRRASSSTAWRGARRLAGGAAAARLAGGAAAARLAFEDDDDGEPRRATMDGERNGGEREPRFDNECVLAPFCEYERHADVHIGILSSAMHALPAL
jgi:hypothetical protein